MLKKINHPLSIVFLSLLLDKLGENIVFPLLPFILEAYKPDALTLGLVASIATLFSVLSAPITGALADSLGRRPVILICIAMNIVSLLMFGWAGSLAFILLSRVVNGLGTATTGTHLVNEKNKLMKEVIKDFYQNLSFPITKMPNRRAKRQAKILKNS